MKRSFWLMMVLMVILTGCDDLMSLLPTPEESVPVFMPQGGLTPEPFSTEMTTAARIAERGAIVVGIRYDLEPLSYISEDTTLSGLEIDLAHELARRWLNDSEAVRFRQVRSDTALEHLESGSVDIVLAGILHTQEKETGADFSPPYFMDGLALLTFPETGISGVGDLGGRNTGILEWTTTLAELQGTLSITPTYAPYGNFFQVIEGLRTRQVDGYIDQRHRLERAKRMVEGTYIVDQLSYQPIAMAYRENDPFFANLVVATFRQIAEDGTLEALYARWIPDAPLPQMPAWPGTPVAQPLSDSPRERYTGNLIEGIKQRGVLEVGYVPDRWPYSADRDDGVQTGFEVRLLERMVESWLGSRQAVTFVPVTEENARQMLQNGELDMLVGGWMHTFEDELHFDFSDVVYDDGVSILSPASAPVGTLDGLAGQPVGVIAGSAGEAAVPALSQLAGMGLNPVPYPNRDAAVEALQGGEVAAILAERRYLLDPLYRVGGFVLSDTRFTYRPLAFVLPQGDSSFRDLVNLTLATLHANGTFAEIYTTWFDDPVLVPSAWPGQPVISLRIQ